MLRVPVISVTGEPLMPAKASRVRRWLKEGKVVVVHNDLKIFTVQLVEETGSNVQPCVVGIDPGKHFTGIAVQSTKATLWLAQIQLPFQTVTERIKVQLLQRSTGIIVVPSAGLSNLTPSLFEAGRSPRSDLTATPLHPATLVGGVSRETR